MGLKILHVTDEALVHPIRVINEVRAQSEAGVEVEVLTFGEHAKPSSAVFAGAVHHHVQWHGLGGKFKALAAECSVYGRLTAGHISRVVDRFQPDVLHVHNIYLIPALNGVIERDNRPLLVLDIAENIPEIMKSYDHVRRGIGKYLIRPNRWKDLEEKGINQSDLLVFVTQEAEQEAHSRVDLSEAKTLCMTNLVWPDSIRSEGPAPVMPAGRMCLYFGDTGMRRGMESMLRGFDLAADQLKDIELVVVGFNAREQEKLKLLRAGLKHANRVHLEGFQPMNKVGHYFQKASIGLCPILRNVHHDTTHANKLFQYARFGIPMLVSDCPSQARLVRDHELGEVHEAGNPVDFSKKLIKMMSRDHDAITSEGAISGDLKLKWSWPHVMRHYLNRIDALLNDRRAHQGG